MHALRRILHATAQLRSPRGAMACAGLALAVAAGAQRPAGAQPGSGGAPHSAPSLPARFAPGVISDAHEQWRITFTPDGRTAYFASSAEFFPFSRQATIYVSTRSGRTWSAPTVASFSGTYSDIDPVVSPTGDRLYFSSIRPIDGTTRDDADLWYVRRTPAGWSEPIHLGPQVNSPASDELYPSVSGDGTLYFASGPLRPQAGQHYDIYRAARIGVDFAPRERLSAAINTSPSPSDPTLQAAWDFNPEISPDGRTLVFTSLRPGGFGLGDLYVSTRRHGAWTPARNLGPHVNTAADEYHPTLARNGRALFFVRRDYPAFRGDFFTVPTRDLTLR